MTKTGLLLALVVVGTCAPACARAVQGPPEIVVDQSVCDHCSMLISEPRFAAAYRVDGRDRVFDEIGCLLAALAEEPQASTAEFWFRDVDDGAWLTRAEAVFVRSDNLPTPMAGGIVATADDVGAMLLGKRHGGAVYRSFDDLVDAGVEPIRHREERR